MTAEGTVTPGAGTAPGQRPVDQHAERPGSWRLYTGAGRRMDEDERDRRWPAPPPWRDFTRTDVAGEARRRLGDRQHRRVSSPDELNAVNAAIYLRRPLLVTGNPGVGKSSLAYRIAWELSLGAVLRWPVTSRSTLRSALYEYDAIGRAQAIDRGADAPTIGDYLHLGPLGTAMLPADRPRVLLIDEMDKSDIDLPNDLLNIFEEGSFVVPELVRTRSRTPVVEVHTADIGKTTAIHDGVVRCQEFPIVVITSNGEREFPPPFLRRCIRLDLKDPDISQLADIVAAHFGAEQVERVQPLIEDFVARRHSAAGNLAADQLLNAIHLASNGAAEADAEAWDELLAIVLRSLSAGEM